MTTRTLSPYSRWLCWHRFHKVNDLRSVQKTENNIFRFPFLLNKFIQAEHTTSSNWNGIILCFMGMKQFITQNLFQTLAYSLQNCVEQLVPFPFNFACKIKWLNDFCFKIKILMCVQKCLSNTELSWAAYTNRFEKFMLNQIASLLSAQYCS